MRGEPCDPQHAGQGDRLRDFDTETESLKAGGGNEMLALCVDDEGLGLEALKRAVLENYGLIDVVDNRHLNEIIKLLEQMKEQERSVNNEQMDQMQ